MWSKLNEEDGNDAIGNYGTVYAEDHPRGDADALDIATLGFCIREGKDERDDREINACGETQEPVEANYKAWNSD